MENQLRRLNGFTAAAKCEQFGLESLQMVSDVSGVSRQTLSNWCKDKPRLFLLVMAGVKYFKDGTDGTK